MPNKITPDIWLERFKKVHPNGEYDYSKSQFGLADHSIKIFHKECGKYFMQMPDKHYRGHGCNHYECSNMRRIQSNTYTQKQVEHIFHQVHGYYYVYDDEYIHANDPDYSVCCTIHGHFNVTPKAHKDGVGCPTCGQVRKSILLRSTRDNVIKSFRRVHNDEYDYIGEYDKHDVPMTIKHIKCGCIFKMTPERHKSGTGCPECRPSNKAIQNIINFLKYYGIKYTLEKTFPGCKNIKLLPFDFVLKKRFIFKKYKYYVTVALERDGEQHTEIIAHFGGLKEYILRIKRDAIKNKYCKDNNIWLIRIPYYINTKEQIKVYLTDKLKNTTFEECNEQNELLEKKQREVLNKYYEQNPEENPNH